MNLLIQQLIIGGIGLFFFYLKDFLISEQKRKQKIQILQKKFDIYKYIYLSCYRNQLEEPISKEDAYHFFIFLCNKIKYSNDIFLYLSYKLVIQLKDFDLYYSDGYNSDCNNIINELRNSIDKDFNKIKGQLGYTNFYIKKSTCYYILIFYIMYFASFLAILALHLYTPIYSLYLSIYTLVIGFTIPWVSDNFFCIVNTTISKREKNKREKKEKKEIKKIY